MPFSFHNRRLGRDAATATSTSSWSPQPGVLVIDVKHYRKAKVEVQRCRASAERTQELYVAGRCKSWLPPLERQRQAVRQALYSAGRHRCSTFVVLLRHGGLLDGFDRW